MAKGVIKGGGSGNNPTLIISDLGGGTTSPGTGGTVGSVSPGAVAQEGSEITYSSAGIALAAGDFVEFTPNADGTGTVTQKICSGQVITGTYDRLLQVTSTSAALIINATVSGKITCNGGTLVIVGNTVIDGKVDIDNGSTVIMSGSQVKINSKVDSLTNNTLKMFSGVVVDGKITSGNDKYVQIQGCTIEGKLEVTGAQACAISGNAINGRVVAGPPCVVS